MFFRFEVTKRAYPNSKNPEKHRQKSFQILIRDGHTRPTNTELPLNRLAFARFFAMQVGVRDFWSACYDLDMASLKTFCFHIS
jgi:hypothetical protein